MIAATRSRVLVVAIAAVALTLSSLAPLPPARAADHDDAIQALVFTGTWSFRHESIPQARAKFAALDGAGELDVDITEDPARISADGLAGYDVLVFLNSGGDYPLSPAQRAELMAWRADGGGVVGIHTPVDGNSDWPEYGRMLGAVFFHHAHTGTAENVVEDTSHPLTAHLPARFTLDEEYYRWQFDPRDNVRVLTSLDRESIHYRWGELFYEPEQPLTWCHENGGRSFYTAYGHSAATYDDPGIWQLILQGVRWAAGRIEADCAPTVPRSPDRLEAEDADDIVRGRVEHSTLRGAELVVTDILHDGHLRFRDVDLTGVRALTINVSVETSPRQFSWRPTVPQPASGGTVHVRLDHVNADDPAGGCDFAGPCAPAADLASVEIAPAAPGWHEVRVELSGPADGIHDLVLAFSDELSPWLATMRMVAPDAADTRPLFTIDSVELEREGTP